MPHPDQEAVVVRERTFDAPPEEVWETLTDEVLLEQWLADDVDLDLREGGLARFTWEDGETRDAEIERVEPAERLTWTWWAEGDERGRVEFQLKPAGAGTRLVVVETRSASPVALGRGGLAGRGINLAALARLHAQRPCLV